MPYLNFSFILNQFFYINSKIYVIPEGPEPSLAYGFLNKIF